MEQTEQREDPKPKLRIVLWNSEGIETLDLLPRSAFNEIDILILNETWATSSFEIPGFYAHHSFAVKRAGPGRPSGGVSVFYNHRVGDLSTVLTEENMIVLSHRNFNLLAAYVRPPKVEPTSYLIEKLLRGLNSVRPSDPLIIAGDFNTRLDLPDSPRTIALLETFADLGCWVANDTSRPTFENHRGSSIIDIFATNMLEKDVSFIHIRHSMKEGVEFQSHLPVGIEVNTENYESVPRRTPSSRRLDIGRLLDRSHEILPVPPITDIDEYSERLVEIFRSSTVSVRPRVGRPWFNSLCQIVRRGQVAAAALASQHAALKPLASYLKTMCRRTYKSQRLRHLEEQVRRLIEDAEKQPYKWLTRAPAGACPVEKTSLILHFRTILARSNTCPRYVPSPTHTMVWDEWTTLERATLEEDISLEEIVNALRRLVNNKAPGPDGLRDELLKDAVFLAPCWVALFNQCLDSGRIPVAWRDALLAVIPKGKGNPTRPESWRGIAKKSVCYKLLAGILTRRLTMFLENLDVIPMEQHGFRSEHSTMTACEILMKDIDKALSRPRTYVFAVFVDYRTAFDSAPRDKVLQTLADVGTPSRVLKLLADILQPNPITIDDGIAELPPFEQTSGLAQGDALSPLLFSVLMKDLPTKVKGMSDRVNFLQYADDVMIYGRSRFHVQQALHRLEKASAELGLSINRDKTEAVKFRRGGHIAATDELRLGTQPLAYVNHFRYLGVTLPANWRSFSAHVVDRCRRAQLAINSIKNPQLLSLQTALHLFDMKVGPTASYGIEVIWEKLTLANLEMINKVKACFLKRTLGLHASTKSRIAFLIAGSPLLIEDLVRRYKLPATETYDEWIKSWETKLAEVDPQIFNTTAMTSDDWKGPGRVTRHLVARFAAHGFHHRLCTTDGFHELSERCRCSRCFERCHLYHAAECIRVESLSRLNSETHK